MKIKFFTAAELDKNLKATIHRSGKLGFTSEAAKKLDLPNMNSADIGKNDEDPNDSNFYLKILPGEGGMLKVIKAGLYYYLNTKILFDNLKISYQKETISYDIIQEDIEGEKIYVLKPRAKPKKKVDDEET